MEASNLVPEFLLRKLRARRDVRQSEDRGPAADVAFAPDVGAIAAARCSMAAVLLEPGRSKYLVVWLGKL